MELSLASFDPDSGILLIPEVPVEFSLGRHGVLLAAITGDLIAGEWSGRPSEFDLAPLNPGRFWTD